MFKIWHQGQNHQCSQTKIFVLYYVCVCIHTNTYNKIRKTKGFPDGSVVNKVLPDNVGDTKDAGLIPGLGRSLGEGNDHPLQYSCLENPVNHYQRNANQNHNEVPLNASQDGCYPKVYKQ